MNTRSRLALGPVTMANAAQIRQLFVYSACIILAITGSLKVFATFGSSRILDQVDPILPMTYRQLLLLSGIWESAVVGFCCVVPVRAQHCVLLLWLAIHFLVYRIGVGLQPGVVGCPCLGTIRELIPRVADALDKGMWVVLAYLLVGSLTFVAWDLWQPRRSPL